MSKIEKSYEYKNIYTPKRRESMKLRFRTNESCCFDDNYGYSPKYWYHGWEKSGQVSRVAMKIIESCIGKSFEVAYSKFIKKFPKLYHGNRNTKEIFFEYFSENINWRNEYDGDFYLDDEYIIRKRTPKDKPKTTGLQAVKLKWNTKVYPLTQELYTILKLIFKEDTASIIEKEYSISDVDRILRKIRDNSYIIYTQGTPEVKATMSVIKEYAYVIHNEYNHNFNKQLFIPTSFEKIIYPTHIERIKEHYDLKHTKRYSSKYWKWKRSYDAEVYLRTYKQKLREKDLLDDSITIERLGFDKLTSFRGLEYHGQKRKRKSSL